MASQVTPRESFSPDSAFRPPLTVTPGGATSRLAEGVGLGRTREPVKKPHQDVVPPVCAQSCAGASGAAQGPPSPPSHSRCWRETLSRGRARQHGPGLGRGPRCEGKARAGGPSGWKEAGGQGAPSVLWAFCKYKMDVSLFTVRLFSKGGTCGGVWLSRKEVFCSGGGIEELRHRRRGEAGLRGR